MVILFVTLGVISVNLVPSSENVGWMSKGFERETCFPGPPRLWSSPTVFQGMFKIRKQKGLTWWQWCMMMKTFHLLLPVSGLQWPGQGSQASGRRTHRSLSHAYKCPGSVVHLQRGLLPTKGTILFLEVHLPSQPRRKTNRFCVQLKQKGGAGNGLTPEVLSSGWEPGGSPDINYQACTA